MLKQTKRSCAVYYRERTLLESPVDSISSHLMKMNSVHNILSLFLKPVFSIIILMK